MSAYQYPHTIENGAGEQLTFVRLVEDATGSWLEVENMVEPKAGPPMHTHHRQEESLTVVAGKIGVEIAGQPEAFYEKGATVNFKPGQAHRFWNAGTEPLICKGWIKPADNVEYFLTEIFNSTKANGGKEPLSFDGAYLLDRYKSEFDMAGIPPLVKKVIFPTTVFLGKLAGRHKKFKNAPMPIK
jgi:quercetin dioxygenase-like cupin family protein